MKVFRKAIFWLHLIAGVVGGIVIFIMCVTGAALSFEKNILENIEHDQRRVPGNLEQQVRLLPSKILTKVLAAKPDARPSSFASLNDPLTAVTVGLGREGQLFIDPYTGNITGEGNKNARSFFGFMTDLHRWIALSGDGRPIGKAIAGACNLMFLLLAISGIYIWFPRKLTWQHVRPSFWFRTGISGTARDFNWHTTIGFWTSLVLIVLTITATVISYQWAGNLIFTLTGDEPPKQNASLGQNPKPQPPFVIPDNIDVLWATAEKRVPGWKSISVRFPIAREAVFTIDEGTSLNIFGRASLALDPATAETVKWEPYAEKTSASQVRSWMRFTHTGESFGIIGQFIGFIACIGGAFLVYTGFALSLRRFALYLRRRSKGTRPFESDTDVLFKSPPQTLEA